VLLTVLGAVLRFLYLGQKSFWTDEGASFVIAHQHWAGFWHTIFTHEANASLYYLLLHFWLQLGDSEFVIRLLSVLAAVVTLPVVYLLGKSLYDRRTGLLAAALLAIHPSHVAYSQEARGYSFLVLFAGLSVCFLVRAMERPSTRLWIWYVLFTVLAVYCHSFALLLVAAQWASLVFLPPQSIRWRGLLSSSAAIGLLTSPLLFLIATQNQGQWAWLPKFSLREFAHLMTFLTGNGARFFLYLFFGVLAAAEMARRSSWRRSVTFWREGLVLSWLLVPILLVSLASLLRPILAPRFLIFCLPAVALPAARGFFAAPYRKLAALALLVLVVLSLSSLRTYYLTPKEDWRGAAQFVLSTAQPGEPILSWDSPAFTYYRERLRDGSNLEFVSPENWLRDPRPLGLRVWLVLYEHDSWNYPGKTILANMREQHRAEDKKVFGHDIWVVRYDVPPK